jgi:hypothetical protein
MGLTLSTDNCCFRNKTMTAEFKNEVNQSAGIIDVDKYSMNTSFARKHDYSAQYLDDVNLEPTEREKRLQLNENLINIKYAEYCRKHNKEFKAE